MTDKPISVDIHLSYEEAEELQSAISDVLCFLKGFRAGRNGIEDHSAFLSFSELIDLNRALKRGINNDQ